MHQPGNNIWVPSELWLKLIYMLNSYILWRHYWRREFQKSLRKCHIISPELLQQSKFGRPRSSTFVKHKRVFKFTSVWFSFKELTVWACIPTAEGLCTEWAIQQVLAQGCFLPRLGHQGPLSCLLAPSCKSEAPFKRGFQEPPILLPSCFVSAEHGGLICPKGACALYSPRWIMTGPLWWEWGSMCSWPDIWSNPVGQGNPNSPTCAEQT